MIASLDKRLIVPELLDALPANDARAMGSRRDLVWINALMLQSRIMAGLLRRHVSTPPRRILELGSGDGAFMLAVARRMGWRDVELVMVDRADLLTQSRRDEFTTLGWRTTPIVADIFDWIARPGNGRFDVACANLVLHHFSDDVLRGLFASVCRLTNVFVATEPRRNTVALAGCSLLKLIGVNDVTLHDAAASVRAGFADEDLSSLWPSDHQMRFEERRRGLFTHAFAAGLTR